MRPSQVAFVEGLSGSLRRGEAMRFVERTPGCLNTLVLLATPSQARNEENEP